MRYPVLFALGVWLLTACTSTGVPAVGRPATGPTSSAGAATPHPFLQEREQNTASFPSGEALFAKPDASPTPAPVPTGSVSQVVAAQPAQAAVLPVPILMYHHIDQPKGSAGAEFFVDPETFRQQMAFLAQNEFTPIDLSYLSAVLAGERPLPNRPIILTFDDGYRDAYENAFPILQSFDFIATFFIITDLIEQGTAAYMTWEMVGDMAQQGMSIESHGQTADALLGLTPEQLQAQIGASREAIASQVGNAPHYLAYPNGEYDAAVIEALQSLNFAGALKANGDWHEGLDLPYEWPRQYVAPDLTLEEFALLVSSDEDAAQLAAAAAEGGVGAAPAIIAERLITTTVYSDQLATSWQMEPDPAAEVDLRHTNEVHNGRYALSFTPTEPGSALFFYLSPDNPAEYRRDDVFGLSFWLYSGDEGIHPDDLSVTMAGSNEYPYWLASDDSLAGQTVETFSGTRLYGLSINRSISPQTWIRVEIVLDDLVYDPLYAAEGTGASFAPGDNVLLDAGYQYVTGFYLKNEKRPMQTIVVDDVELLLITTAPQG